MQLKQHIATLAEQAAKHEAARKARETAAAERASQQESLGLMPSSAAATPARGPGPDASLGVSGITRKSGGGERVGFAGRRTGREALIDEEVRVTPHAHADPISCPRFVAGWRRQHGHFSPDRRGLS
jgi:hypothetical protein